MFHISIILYFAVCITVLHSDPACHPGVLRWETLDSNRGKLDPYRN